jgi:hypothetical protein
MLTRGRLALLCAVLLAGAVAAPGQSGPSDVADRVDTTTLEGESYAGPHAGYNWSGDDFIDDEMFLGGRLGTYLSNNFAIETTWDGFWGTGCCGRNDFTQIQLGGLYNFTPTRHGWNTYLGFGGGQSRPDIFDGKGNWLGYASVGSEYRMENNVGIRIEAKGVYNLEADAIGNPSYVQDDHFDVQPNVGLIFHWGGVRPAAVVVPPPPPPPPAPPVVAPAPEPPPAPPVVAPPPPRAEPAPPPPTSDVLAFDRGRYRLTNIAKAQLDQVALRLRDNRGASAVVTGFPDDPPGSKGADLARQRADAAKAYLIDRHQIDASRIRTETDMSSSDNRGDSVVVVNFSR